MVFGDLYMIVSIGVRQIFFENKPSQKIRKWTGQLKLPTFLWWWIPRLLKIPKRRVGCDEPCFFPFGFAVFVASHVHAQVGAVLGVWLS